MINLRQVVFVATCLVLCFPRPTSYDVRSQPYLTQYADYSVQADGICVGYSWAKQLAQIVSNTASLITQNQVSLSAQSILECPPYPYDVCINTTLLHLTAALHYIEKTGITLDYCYLNRPLASPTKCKDVCEDGFDFPQVYKAKAIQYSNANELLAQYEVKDQTVAFITLNHFESMNQYRQGTLSGNGPMYGVTVAEVVGWKDKGKILTIKVPFGEQWGYNGYAFIAHDSPFIIGFYQMSFIVQGDKVMQ